MRVIVCGSRDFKNKALVYTLLEGLLSRSIERSEPLVVIEGACPTGADEFANQWVEYKKDKFVSTPIIHRRIPAKWTVHDFEGNSGIKCRCAPDAPKCKAAGIRRNEKMLKEESPDATFGFSNDIENSNGTRDMLTRSKAAGLPAISLGEF